MIDQAQTDEEIYINKLADNVVSKYCSGLCDTSHVITTQDVINYIAKLKPYTVEEKFDTYSNNLINGSHKLYMYT